jgi:hypothetical protein
MSVDEGILEAMRQVLSRILGNLPEFLVQALDTSNFLVVHLEPLAFSSEI